MTGTSAVRNPPAAFHSESLHRTQKFIASLMSTLRRYHLAGACNTAL